MVGVGVGGLEKASKLRSPSSMLTSSSSRSRCFSLMEEVVCMGGREVRGCAQGFWVGRVMPREVVVLGGWGARGRGKVVGGVGWEGVSLGCG